MADTSKRKRGQIVAVFLDVTTANISHTALRLLFISKYTVSLTSCLHLSKFSSTAWPVEALACPSCSDTHYLVHFHPGWVRQYHVTS